jgi:hypothetical protein
VTVHQRLTQGVDVVVLLISPDDSGCVQDDLVRGPTSQQVDVLSPWTKESVLRCKRSTID